MAPISNHGSRLEYLANLHRDYLSDRAAHYRSNSFYHEVQADISARRPIDLDRLRKYLSISNKRTRKIIGAYDEQYNELSDPVRGEYQKAVKGCIDARAQMRDVVSYLRRKIVHENSAGATVRKGKIFTDYLAPSGVGYVVAHTGCGAENFAHAHHCGTFDGTPDPHLAKVAEAIPYAIARVENPNLRTALNAINQANVADLILLAAEKGFPVFPLVYDLSGWSNIGDSGSILGSRGVDLKWVSPRQKVENPMVAEMRETVRLLWEVAESLGRNPEGQFAHTVFIYDVDRLGRFNDPHVIFDLLPNESVSVTADFKRVSDGEGMSSTAIAAIKYAAIHDGGHISGVGGKGGNHHVLVLDPDPNVATAVETQLLTDASIREATRNGETILRCVYDKSNYAVSFID